MSVETVTLHDRATGSEAKVLTGYGFNCCQFRVQHEGKPLDILWAESGFDSGDRRASGSGIPLLFPYPGRLRGQTLTWEGRDYPLEGDDSRGNAIHGYVLARPWRVIEKTDDRVVGQFHASRDDASLLEKWPADFCITARYELAGNSLRSSFLIENPDDKPLPCGLGTHPYFCVPLGGSDAAACRIELAVSKYWEQTDMLPTGRILPVEDVAKYREGLPFGEMSFDNVFTDLRFEDSWCTSRINDSTSGRNLVLRFDEAFRECVVYNPPHREAVCIEPYTCVPNSPEMESAGNDSGLRILQPGESFSAEVVMEVV